MCSFMCEIPCDTYFASRRKLMVFLTSTECSELNNPSNGKVSCRKVSGKLLCTLSCDEDYSFNAEAVTVYGCGPDTNWQWNDMEELVLPKCSST